MPVSDFRTNLVILAVMAVAVLVVLFIHIDSDDEGMGGW
jgi:hypothetical protein